MLRYALVVVLMLGCGSKKKTEGTVAPPTPPTSTAPPASDETLKQLQDRTTVCAQDSDCVHLGDRCAWGCAVTVNKKYEAEVEAWFGKHDTKCAIDCPAVDKPVCQQGRCNSPDRK